MTEIRAIEDGWVRSFDGGNPHRGMSLAEEMWRSGRYEFVELRSGSFVAFCRQKGGKGRELVGGHLR